MRPETRALVFAAAALPVFSLVAVFLRLPLFVVVFFGPMASALAVLGILYLPKYPVREMRATPEASLEFLARHFRLAGYRVTESPGALIIRLGPHSAARVVARPTPTGCDVRYQAYATPSGWGTLITLIILGYTAFPGFVLAVYGFFRARSFASSQLIPALPEDGSLPAAPPADDTRTTLLEALSEARRVAAEAHEALRSSYWDFQGVVVGGAIIVWLILFVLISSGIAEPDFARRMLTGFAWAGAYTWTFAGLSAWLVRRRMRPRVLVYRGRAIELENAFRRESSRTSPEGGEPSTFEILAEASKEVPVWVETTRRPRLSRDPTAGILIVMVVFWTYGLASAAIGVVFFAPLLAALLVAGGATLVASTIWLYRRWRRRWDTETIRILGMWKQRIEDVRTRMDKYLEDL